MNHNIRISTTTQTNNADHNLEEEMSTSQGTTAKRALGAALMGLAMAGGMAPPAEATQPTNNAISAVANRPTEYTIATGWKDDWDGGCRAKATVTYLPGTDTAIMNTTVQSPYWLVGCRVRTRLHVRTASNVFRGSDQYMTACGVFDATCASTRSSGDQTFKPAAPSFTSYVSDLNAALEEAGAPPTTRTALTRGISVSFSKP